MRDDGVGVHAVKEIGERFRFTPEIDIVDGGISIASTDVTVCNTPKMKLRKTPAGRERCVTGKTEAREGSRKGKSARSSSGMMFDSPGSSDAEETTPFKLFVHPESHVAFRSLTDNGIGIDPELFGRLFSLFQRLNPGDKYPGSDVGLAVAKKIAARHGGRIWVESRPGKGSALYFSISAKTGREENGKRV